MSPHPAITPPPILPRQDPNDPYGISSMLASLSAEFPELYSYSAYSYDSAYYSSLYASLLSEYSITVPSITVPSITVPTLTGNTRPTATATGGSLTGTARATTRTGTATATGATDAASAAGAADASSSSTPSGTGKSGMSTGAKVGIAVGVVLGLLVLAGIGILLWCLGKKKGKKNSTTIVAPGTAQSGFAPQPQQQQPPQTPQQYQQQPQMGYANNQGYMPGFAPPQQTVSPPPQYAQQQAAGMAGAYAPYAKGPDPNVAELEHEYHFAKPGVVEIGDGVPEQGANERR